MSGEQKQVFTLIGKAMAEIGAITKNKEVDTRKYKYRGIDDVYNSLNPVLSKYGLFICPEVIDHQREERQSTKGGNLIYSILTVKYTVYAPDGSFICTTVIGEGMDSGDKATNKAMSAAMKYAMFQLFCIATEEMKDPDAETPPPSKPVTITEKEAMVLANMLGKDSNVKIILNRFNVSSLSDLTPQQYTEAVRLWQEYKNK